MFRSACRAQAGAAMRFLGQWMGRFAPQGKGRIVVRTGCLIFFPFITLMVWMIQAIVWLTIAVPILAYALIMAIVGGGFHAGSKTTAPPESIAAPAQTPHWEPAEPV